MASISDLPNEILNGILDYFRTVQLLRLMRTNRRFHDLIASIVPLRVRQAAPAPNRAFIIECYTRAEALRAPSMAGQFMHAIGPGAPDDADLSGVAKWYSVFRPYESGIKWPQGELVDEGGGEAPTQVLHLDDGQTETEMITRCLVRKWDFWPRMASVHDGVVKIDRQWLLDMASSLTEVDEPRWDDGSQRLEGDRGILWINKRKDMGIQCRVSPWQTDRMPVLVGADDLPAMAFIIAFEGFFIRSWLLHHAIELQEAGSTENWPDCAWGALIAVS